MNRLDKSKPYSEVISVSGTLIEQDGVLYTISGKPVVVEQAEEVEEAEGAEEHPKRRGRKPKGE